MKVTTRILMAVTAVFVTAVTLHAQTYNDSVRTKTWSVYVQGGLSGYHGARGKSFDNSRMPFSPDLSLGVKYNIKPWVRLGLNAGYTMVKSVNKGVISETKVIPGFQLGGYTTDLEVQTDMIQNRYDMHLAGVDLNVDFNIMDIWHNRKAQRWNLYAGLGVGYMHGWNRNTQTVAINETAIAEGNGYYNVYNHSSMDSWHENSQLNLLYIPASLSLEFDVNPWWTIGVIGQYKYLPLDEEFSPKGIYSAGLLLRYNFVRMKTNKRLYHETVAELRTVQENNAELQDKLAAVEAEKSEADRLLDEQKRLNDTLEKDLADCKRTKTGNHVVYFLISGSKLSQQEQLRLDEYVEKLKSVGGYSLTIIGEASADGNSKANQKLSEQRLERVAKYLRKNGIADTYIKIEKAIGDSEQGYDPKYRRVRIINGGE